MAILKDLIVHGSSRFLNKIYASEIQTPLIEAEAGIFKKLKADDATVVGLLDVKGQLHTNSWSNSNIATIDGSFYITPTIGSGQGTITITSSTLKFTRKDTNNSFAVESLYLGDNNSITWPSYSKVLVTGQVKLNGEWIPLGTLLGQINGVATAASISINNIKDNKKPPSNTSNVYTTLVNSGVSSTNYRNLKISLYQRAASQTDFRPLGIYMTAIGDNGRTFLDIYGGVNSLNTTSSNYGGLAEPNVRIGNLQGLPNVGGQTPSGWGIYTDNGYFKGIIAADRGYIGTGSRYWVIGNYEDGSNSDNDRSYIYNGTNSITSTVEGIYLGTDGIRNYKDNTHYVTIKDGVISALGVDLSGKIIASSGFIGGWNIGTDTNKSLYHGNQTPGATTTNLVLSPTSATNSNAIGGSATGLNWFLSAGKVFGVTTSGALYATSGKIGGWSIDSNSLTIGSWGTDNSAMLCTGTGGSKSIGGSESINNWVFTAGANFGVTKSGALYASSANISGKVVATSGSIGGIEIENGVLKVSSINIGDLNGVSNYALKTEITDAEKVATSYITYIDSTEGIKIHNISDQVNYLKLNSSAISMYRNDIETLNISDNEIRIGKFSDKNVCIDNDSVDIRNGTTTLASFTGDNTRFYDPIYKKELATFGASGAIIGANSEQRFVIEKDGIKSINDSGATVFSVNSTNGTVVTEAQVASGGESSYLSGKTVVFDTVGTGFTTNTTFYTKKLTAIIGIRNSAKPLTNVKVNSVTATSTLVDSYSGYWYSSTHSINLSPFTFTYGTSKRETYQITASFVNDYGDSYNLTAQASINYDGNVTLTVQLLTGECVRTSGNNEDIAIMDLIGSKVIYGEIYQSSAYTKAPAMTFGTRGKNAILAPFSVTIGEDLYANNDNQLSIGRYNLKNDEFFQLAFAIGNGTSDIDRSNAFDVDWDGNVSVGGAETVKGNLYAKGRLLYNSTSTPLFKVVTRTIDNISIGVNTGSYPSVAVNESGYTPVAISSITLDKASSSGTTYGWCVVQSTVINGQTLNFYVGNWSASSAAKIKMVIKVLCIRTSAL